MKVNLLKERNKSYSINWTEIVIIISLALIIMVVGYNYYSLYTKSTYLSHEVDSLNRQFHTLQLRIVEYNKLKNKVAELSVIRERMESLKYIWDEAVIEQGYVVPAKLMIETLTVEKKNIHLDGRASDNQKVLDLLNNMKLSPIYQNIRINKLESINNSDTAFRIDAVLIEEGDDDV